MEGRGGEGKRWRRRRVGHGGGGESRDPPPPGARRPADSDGWDGGGPGRRVRRAGTGGRGLFGAGSGASDPVPAAVTGVRAVTDSDDPGRAPGSALRELHLPVLTTSAEAWEGRPPAQAQADSERLGKLPNSERLRAQARGLGPLTQAAAATAIACRGLPRPPEFMRMESKLSETLLWSTTVQALYAVCICDCSTVSRRTLTRWTLTRWFSSVAHGSSHSHRIGGKSTLAADCPQSSHLTQIGWRARCITHDTRGMSGHGLRSSLARPTARDDRRRSQMSRWLRRGLCGLCSSACGQCSTARSSSSGSSPQPVAVGGAAGRPTGRWALTRQA